MFTSPEWAHAKIGHSDIQTRVEDGQVIYIFYKKDVANPLLLCASSAMPLKMKRTASDKNKGLPRKVILMSKTLPCGPDNSEKL